MAWVFRILGLCGSAALTVLAACESHHPPQIIAWETPDGNHQTLWSCKGDAAVARVGDRYTVQFTDENGARVYRANLSEVVVSEMPHATCPP